MVVWRQVEVFPTLACTVRFGDIVSPLLSLRSRSRMPSES